MFFFGLAIFAICAWAFPWWATSILAFVLGLITRQSSRRALQLAFSAAVAWAALAFILDGRSHGLISRRMAGLFNLPNSAWMFFAMAVFGGLTVMLSYLAASPLQSIWSKPRNDSTSSVNS